MTNTPEQEAEALIERFYPLTWLAVQKEGLDNDAKRCALICCDKIIEEIDMYKGELNPRWEFWNQVKQHLSK